MTLAERKVWSTLRKLRLPFRRQAPIGPYIVDFAFHSAGLIIELDGPRHDLPEAQLHDAHRDAWLRSQGYNVLRFRNEQALYETEIVREIILATLPPRWGKGRDGGDRAEGSEEAMETPPLAPNTKLGGLHPRPCPSPIEGEGAQDRGRP